MGIVKKSPTSPGRRFQTTSTFEEITRDTPEKGLLKPLRKSGGRNNYGRMTIRHVGGGHKRRYRIIDFKRDKKDIPAKVISIEYDPNRSARIALLQYVDGEKRYIIAPVNLNVGETVIASESADIKSGNALPLRNIPSGTVIHNVELNIDHENISLGKAGRRRWLGKRPRVRGVAMNPVDHPMGGGEGKSSGGRHPVTPWGVPTKGFKTRRNKATGKYIVKKRK